MQILVTGGAGYIGSHAVRRLGDAGWDPVTLDNLSEGHREAVLAGALEVGDLADEQFLDDLFRRYRFQAVMHFASRCTVGESVRNPRRYFEENLGNALTLFRVMLRHGVDRFVFSSTCATYGLPVRVPIDELHPQQPVNPYGDSKLMIEQVLRRYDEAYGLKSVSLRYFNAAGAAPDAVIGESHDPETHLVPLVLQVAAGRRPHLELFGDDYPTRDGTCVRDYIHVLDLADAHLLALEWLLQAKAGDCFNLGTGQGWTVREVVDAAARVTGADIPVQMAGRREGDPPELVADPGKAARVLGWSARWLGLESVVETAWRWEQARRY